MWSHVQKQSAAFTAIPKTSLYPPCKSFLLTSGWSLAAGFKGWTSLLHNAECSTAIQEEQSSFHREKWRRFRAKETQWMSVLILLDIIVTDITEHQPKPLTAKKGVRGDITDHASTQNLKNCTVFQIIIKNGKSFTLWILTYLCSEGHLLLPRLPKQRAIKQLVNLQWRLLYATELKTSSGPQIIHIHIFKMNKHWAFSPDLSNARKHLV